MTFIIRRRRVGGVYVVRYVLGLAFPHTVSHGFLFLWLTRTMQFESIVNACVLLLGARARVTWLRWPKLFGACRAALGGVLLLSADICTVALWGFSSLLSVDLGEQRWGTVRVGSSIQSEGIVHFNYCRSRYGCQAYVIPVWHRVDTSFILYFF